MIHWSEVTAVFGGTFDPPHLGHREAISGLFQCPGVKRVLVIVAAHPPHKQVHTSIQHRLKMAEICFASHSKNPFPNEIEINQTEISRHQTTGKPSYSFDTLIELKRSVSSLACVIGADQLKDLPQWHRFPEILGLAHWLILERKPFGQKFSREILREWEGSGLIYHPTKTSAQHLWKISKFNTFLSLFQTEAPNLSSKAIRQSIERTGEPPANALLPEVASYLKQNQLYGTTSLDP
jgi:nicotinate-nucleotide adenylyltransferase